MQKTILKYEDDPLDIELGEQDEELQRLVMAIEEKGKEDLAAIVAESGDDVGDEVMRTWQKDVSTHHEFLKDQLKNRMSLSSFSLSLSLSLSLSFLIFQDYCNNNHFFNCAHYFQVLRRLETDRI